MAAPTPARPRSSGGTPLIILGIVLAVVAAILVLFLTTNGGGGGGGGGTVNVVMAAQSLPVGTILTRDGGSGNVRVADAFHVERLPASAVPSDAYTFTSMDALSQALDNQIVQSSFLAGDILRSADKRMAKIGSSDVKSIANHKPGALQSGQVVFALHLTGDLQIGVQEDDHIDLLATECVQSSHSSGNCQVAQTTLQDLAVYMVGNGFIYLAVSHQDALILKLLVETAKLDIVLRKPGDDAHATTQPVDAGTIISRFGFTAP